MPDAPMRFVPRHDLEWVVLDAEVVVLDRALGELMRLDQVGGFIWKQLDGHRTGVEIAREVADRFATDLDVALRDVGEFLARLRSFELVEQSR